MDDKETEMICERYNFLVSEERWMDDENQITEKGSAQREETNEKGQDNQSNFVTATQQKAQEGEDDGSESSSSSGDDVNQAPDASAEAQSIRKPEFKTEEEKQEGLKQADQKYKDGCALYKDGKLAESVDTLYEALEIRLAILGERAAACGQVYLKLGDVLLALGRERGNDFSSALIKKRLKETMNITGMKSAPKAKNARIDLSDSEDEEDDEGEEEVVKLDAGEDYLDESWKMLESARVIYSAHRQTHPLELSDVYQSLGDLALELELKPEETLREYTECIQLREALPANSKGKDRLMAEAHFNLALAQQYHNDVKSAKENFRVALSYLQKRLSQVRAENFSTASNSPKQQSVFTSGMAREGDDEVKKPQQQKSPEEEDLLAVIDDVQQKLDEVSDVAAHEAAKAALMAVLKPQAQQAPPTPSQQQQQQQPTVSATNSIGFSSSSSTGGSALQNNGASNSNGQQQTEVHLGTFGRKRKPTEGESNNNNNATNANAKTASSESSSSQPVEKREKTEKS